MHLDALVASTQFEHSQQVARISELLARRLGYSPEETAVIAQAAAFHDIGKVFIPKEILGKPGPLTTEEYEIVKTHTELGYREITNAIQVFQVAAAMCRDHHEWVDGIGGYAGRKDIHPYVQLVSVADVYDALASPRSYKKGWKRSEIRDYFLAQAGHQFDCRIVDQLLASLDDTEALYHTQGGTPDA